MSPEKFLIDLVNSGIFGKVCKDIRSVNELVSEVGFEKLTTNFVDLSFLDKL